MTATHLPPASGSTGADWSWLRDDLPALLRLATVLTGDPQQGSALVAAALSRERRRTEDFPEVRLRQLVVSRYLSGSGWTGSRSSSARDRLAHACLVLRHLEGLTLAETATVVDRPVSQVATDVTVDERHPHELRATLVRLADTALGPDTVLAELDQASRRLGRHRRRRAGLIVTAALLVAMLALVPSVLLPRLPGQTRVAGVWSLIHRVTPPAGWTVLGRSVAPTMESTTLRPDRGRGDETCSVDVYVPGGLDLDLVPEQRDPVRVNGHPAFYSDGDGGDFSPLLAFRYATDAWTMVMCPGDSQLDRPKLMALARAVRFKPDTVRLPFKLAAVPVGYRVESATQTVAPVGADLMLAMTEIRVGDANMAISFSPMDAATDDSWTETTQINGHRALLDETSSHPRLCLAQGAVDATGGSAGPAPDTARSYVCIAAYWPLGDWPARAPLPTNMGPVLIQTAELLELTDDLSSTDDWYAGEDAIPAG